MTGGVARLAARAALGALRLERALALRRDRRLRGAQPVQRVDELRGLARRDRRELGRLAHVRVAIVLVVLCTLVLPERLVKRVTASTRQLLGLCLCLKRPSSEIEL